MLVAKQTGSELSALLSAGIFSRECSWPDASFVLSRSTGPS